MIPPVLRAKMTANFRANFGKSRMTDFAPVIKIFDPSGGATWLLSELGPDEIAFGLCDLGMGTPELGYVSIHELAAQRIRSSCNSDDEPETTEIHRLISLHWLARARSILVD